MAIRAYFCFWSLDGNNVTNPIRDLLITEPGITGFQWAAYHYPAAGLDGLPVKPFCMVLVKSTDFTAINAIPDVDKFPVLDLNTPINDIPSLKNAAINLLKNKYEVPLARFADCVTWKDVAHVVLKYFDVNFRTLGDHISDGEFA